MRLFYQVILGTINLENATSKLLNLYSDMRIEKPAVKGEAILAVAVVDKDGCLVKHPAVAVSSFAWGVPQALKGDLGKLDKCAADTNRFNAPDASAQTLADAATPYYAEFEGRYGSRSVGVPLLVHRRCADPMFKISNVIAYERLMVQAKQPGTSAIRNCLGPSCWINILGQAIDKWCPDEGDRVLNLLLRLREASVKPDLYIITPFVIVADNLRRLIRSSDVLQGWTDEPYSWIFERIGTVHTVQGREAEAVIFVLGAPLPDQTGARAWAGRSPNLLNVAVTRAKEVLYVIGNRQLWSEAGLFAELASKL